MALSGWGGEGRAETPSLPIHPFRSACVTCPSLTALIMSPAPHRLANSKAQHVRDKERDSLRVLG